MIITTIFKKLYIKHIAKKWKIKEVSANMLASTFLSDYKKHKFSFSYIHRIHKYGYSIDDWRFCGLTKENYKEFLSTAQYYGMHPLNGRHSKWIDDKLTLKYLCHGTAMQSYMPEYYYQINEKGEIIPLMDCSKGEHTVESILKTLREKETLAIKLIAGSIGKGFIKAEFINGAYFFNGNKLSEIEFSEKIAALRNYLITEYLKPHQTLAKFCPNTCNAIRYLIGRMPDGSIKLLKAFIRFGTIKSGFVENYNAGGVLCYIDETGVFNGGNIAQLDTRLNLKINEHPDTKEKLAGQLPCWAEMVEGANLLSKIFPQMQYLGIDYVVTDNGKVKIIEINSLSSLDTLQLDGSILQSPTGIFYKQRLH